MLLSISLIVSSGRPDNTGSSFLSSAVMTTTMKSYPMVKFGHGVRAGTKDLYDHDVFPIVRSARIVRNLSSLEVQLSPPTVICPDALSMLKADKVELGDGLCRLEPSRPVSADVIV